MLTICQASRTTRKKGWTACTTSMVMAKKLISKTVKKAQAKDRTKFEFGNRIRLQFQKAKTIYY